MIAFPFTFRAGDVEIREELHLDLLKAITKATLAAAIT